MKWSSMVPENKKVGQAGVTLFELLVAVLLLATASSMIYSVMHTSIRFSEKGDRKLQAIAREYGLLGLMHRQIKCAMYDNPQRRAMISADSDILRVVTRKPLLYRSSDMVLAVYRYNADEQAVYYTEKKDFYNMDYNDRYFPDFNEMDLLAKGDIAFSVSHDMQSGEVQVELQGKTYAFSPRSSDIPLGGILGI